MWRHVIARLYWILQKNGKIHTNSWKQNWQIKDTWSWRLRTDYIFLSIMKQTWCTFHSDYWESRYSTCFERYLFSLRTRCTNGTLYIACLYARNIQSAVCVVPPEYEQVMLETCRESRFSINWIKNASRWLHYIDILWCTVRKSLRLHVCNVFFPFPCRIFCLAFWYIIIKKLKFTALSYCSLLWGGPWSFTIRRKFALRVLYNEKLHRTKADIVTGWSRIRSSVACIFCWI
jgi:hypothetical protein